MSRVVIAAADARSAEAVRILLRFPPRLEVLGYISTSGPIQSTLAGVRADLVVVDDSADHDRVLAAVRDIRIGAAPSAKVVVLARNVDPGWMSELVRTGADAVVAREMSAGSLAVVLSEISHGAVVTCRPAGRQPPLRQFPQLTEREVEVLHLLSVGTPNAGIARSLFVTEQTVKFHLSNVYRKLGVANRTEAARYALVHGLLDHEDALRPTALKAA
jgi:DNA-binding NarL/FixJ family response regulator